jgi:hypothetical protein
MRLLSRLRGRNPFLPRFFSVRTLSDTGAAAFSICLFLITKLFSVIIFLYGTAKTGRLETDTIKGGVLRTGDLGRILENGHIILGTLNAGHPGGMLPLTAAEKDSLHPSVLPSNLYVADATLHPEALGNPPILTIMALAERIASLL